MMKQKITYSLFITLLVVAAACIPGSAKAQHGKVTVVGAEKLELAVGARNRVQQGYRIQVYFGTDRKTAEEIREKIKQDYPELAVYFLYQQPNYKIRAGNYTRIIDAQAALHKLGADFKGSFVVSDQIEIPK